jgi:hypothetical protein
MNQFSEIVSVLFQLPLTWICAHDSHGGTPGHKKRKVGNSGVTAPCRCVAPGDRCPAGAPVPGSGPASAHPMTVRPLLSRWHPELQAWEHTRPANVSPQAHETSLLAGHAIAAIHGHRPRHPRRLRRRLRGPPTCAPPSPAAGRRVGRPTVRNPTGPPAAPTHVEVEHMRHCHRLDTTCKRRRQAIQMITLSTIRTF